MRDRVFYEGDIADRGLLTRVVRDHPDIEATVHMAARIVVRHRSEQAPSSVVNVGTGTGVTVRELVAERTSQKRVRLRLVSDPI